MNNEQGIVNNEMLNKPCFPLPLAPRHLPLPIGRALDYAALHPDYRIVGCAVRTVKCIELNNGAHGAPYVTFFIFHFSLFTAPCLNGIQI